MRFQLNALYVIFYTVAIGKFALQPGDKFNIEQLTKNPIPIDLLF